MLQLPPCPHCGGPLEADTSVRASHGVRCTACKTKFDVVLEERVDATGEEVLRSDLVTGAFPAITGTPSPFAGTGTTPDAQVLATAADLPPGMVIESSDDRMTIAWRWWGASSVFITLFALAWNAFMVMWYTMAVVTGAWEMALFGLLHLGVGLGMAYLAVAHVVNRTTVSLLPTRVQVAHGPLPWLGAQTLARADLDQLYVLRQESRTKNGVSITYDVTAVLRDGREIPLVKGLDAPAQAHFLERRIEDALGILDRPMPNEYRD